MTFTTPILASDQVPFYLLEKGLLSAKDIVLGGVEVVSISRRNHNFLVRTPDGPCWFLKQGLGPEGRRGVSREASVYDLLEQVQRETKILCGLLPERRLFDAELDLLITSSTTGLQSFFEYQRKRRRISHTRSAAVGCALGVVHKTVSKVWNHPSIADRASLPFGLRVHNPDLSIYEFASQGCLEVVKTVQESSELCDSLDSVAAEWQPEGFIHGDARWDNCLVGSQPESARNSQTWLVDWELARAGDPYWDAGSHLGEYLHCWIRSAPLSGATPPARFMEFARTPLASLWPAMQAFWAAYTSTRKLSASEADKGLIRTVRHAGAWLVQAAFEAAQRASQASCHSICMLQVAANVLRRPQEAASRLFGLSLRPG